MPINYKIIPYATKLSEFNPEDLYESLSTLNLRQTKILPTPSEHFSPFSKVTIGKFKSHPFESFETFYKFSFSLPKNPDIAHLHFFVDLNNKEVLFWGLIINENHQGKGLSKKCLNFFISFFKRLNFEIKTTPQHKPLTCLILVKLGFVPANEGTQIIINSEPSSNSTEIWFEGKWRPSGNLFKSQNILKLPEKPTNSSVVTVGCVYTLT